MPFPSRIGERLCNLPAGNTCDDVEFRLPVGEMRLIACHRASKRYEQCPRNVDMSSQMPLFFRLLGPHLGTIALIQVCLFPIAAKAQERVRTSAGRLPIESFRSVPETFLHIGPFQEVLIGSGGVAYTDNANLSPSADKVSRLRFYQDLSLETTWVISHLNLLQFKLGGTLYEDFFGNGRTKVSTGISPDSLIQFQFVVSNLRVRLFDQFSYVQDPNTNPTATNTAYLNNLTNTVGAVVDADFNLFILSLAADYTYNNQSGSNAEGQSNGNTTGTRDSYRVTPSVTFQLSPTVQYGLNATFTRTTGSGGENGGASQNVNSFSVGPFMHGKLSTRTDFDLSVGALIPRTKPSLPPTYYYSAIIRHQFNRNWQLIFSAAHDLIFTTGVDLTEETTVRLGTELNLTRFVSVGGSSFVNFGDEKTGGTTGNFAQYGIELGLGWKPHKRWSTGLTYDFLRRTADSAANSYIQNTIAFNVSYKF